MPVPPAAHSLPKFLLAHHAERIREPARQNLSFELYPNPPQILFRSSVFAPAGSPEHRDM
ncbi:hypothetical protein C9E81_20850 [Paracoccus alkanivorans]|uniref:Uncharacterized protein n=1 Tax=Paracoccus alkanivorans TaxID=2116655 RepID=A0A3M0M6Q0_9RHOB|nr:hypothetical protein C9E81_20850 [Paracoccus alkanivorans]